MDNDFVSSENTNKQERASRNFIIDEFLDIQRITHTLAAIRDGCREASGSYEFEARQEIIDIVLEHDIYCLNRVLKNMCNNTFEGL